MRFFWFIICTISFPISLSADDYYQVGGSDRKLSNELIQMEKEDQLYRSSESADVEKLIEVENKNTARLKEIVKETGWPTISLVGEDASRSAWVIAQHSDRDRDFQKTVLPLIKQYLDTNDVKSIHYAYLFDRINDPQRYGTQGECVSLGLWRPREIDDLDNVNQRRLSMKLKPPSLEDYVLIMSQFCN